MRRTSRTALSREVSMQVKKFLSNVNFHDSCAMGSNTREFQTVAKFLVRTFISCKTTMLVVSCRHKHFGYISAKIHSLRLVGRHQTKAGNAVSSSFGIGHLLKCSFSVSPRHFSTWQHLPCWCPGLGNRLKPMKRFHNLLDLRIFPFSVI